MFFKKKKIVKLVFITPLHITLCITYIMSIFVLVLTRSSICRCTATCTFTPLIGVCPVCTIMALVRTSATPALTLTRPVDSRAVLSATQATTSLPRASFAWSARLMTHSTATICMGPSIRRAPCQLYAPSTTASVW